MSDVEFLESANSIEYNCHPNSPYTSEGNEDEV